MAATGNTRQRTLQKLPDPIRLSKKEHVLLMHSESVKSIPWLNALLIENRRITAEVLARLAVEEQNVFWAMKPELVKQATAEWIGDLCFFAGRRRQDLRNASCTFPVQPPLYSD